MASAASAAVVAVVPVIDRRQSHVIMGNKQRSKSSKKGHRPLAKSRINGQFVPMPPGGGDENADPNILIVPGRQRQPESRRERAAPDERTKLTIRSLEESLEATRRQVAKLKVDVEAWRADSYERDLKIIELTATVKSLQSEVTKRDQRLKRQADRLATALGKDPDQRRERSKLANEAAQRAARRAREQAEKSRAQLRAKLQGRIKDLQLELRNRPTVAASAHVRPSTCIPDRSGNRSRYDYVRNQAIALERYLSNTFSDGATGESSQEVLLYFLDHQQDFTRRIITGLEIPQAIEAEVVRHLQEHLCQRKAAAMKNATGMTWEGYRCFNNFLFRERHSTSGRWVPIRMPFGGKPPQAVPPHQVYKFERSVHDIFGLKESEDGITAWCDAKKMLVLRLEQFPDSQLPAPGELLRIFCGADAFRGYKAFSTKFVLCVMKALLERTDDRGRRLEGWTANSGENCVRMALYEGGDGYMEFSSKGSTVMKQMADMKQNGLMVHGRHFPVRLGMFGDMSFLMSAVGGSSCNAYQFCVQCDCHRDHMSWTLSQFDEEGEWQLCIAQMKTDLSPVIWLYETLTLQCYYLQVCLSPRP